MEYSINIWACKPFTDDLCMTGIDVATKAEALAIYNDPETHFADYFRVMHDPEVWVEVVGPDLEEERCLWKRKDSRRDDDAEWRREIAMEAGMLHGVDAYNEVMGY